MSLRLAPMTSPSRLDGLAGLWTTCHGLWIACHGLWVARSGMWMACNGLTWPVIELILRTKGWRPTDLGQLWPMAWEL